MEVKIERIKTKLKTDDFDLISLEKKILEIENSINEMENILNHNDSEFNSSNSSDSTNSDDSEENIDIHKIIKDIEILEKKMSTVLETDTIENIIECYRNLKNKINSVRIQNENFKLSIGYL